MGLAISYAYASSRLDCDDDALVVGKTVLMALRGENADGRTFGR